VEEQPNFKIGGFEVVVELSQRVRMECVRGLHFHNQTIVHDHVEALMSEYLALVSNENSKLPCYPVPSGKELALQRHHVEGLEKAVSKSVVNLKEHPDDRMREVFIDECGPHDQQ